MREPPRRESSSRPGAPQRDAHLKAAMRARGWLKVVLVTVAINEIFTVIFAYVAQQVDPGLTVMPTLVFSCATCALVSGWLLVDARNAWHNAKEKGYLRSGGDEHDDDLPTIADHCPKRWLVVLHLELHPDLAGTL